MAERIYSEPLHIHQTIFPSSSGSDPCLLGGCTKSTDIEKVMEYGVMSMPAIVVNDKVIAFGKVLKTAEVEKLMK